MELKLFYMGEVADMSEQQTKDAEKFIAGLEYGIIATNNPKTGARLSALNNLAGQTLKQLHFGTEISCQKVKNIQADPRCEIMYTNGAGGQMMLSGKMEVLIDPEIKKVLWQDWMNEYSPEDPEGNNICILRFKPESVRAMIE